MQKKRRIILTGLILLVAVKFTLAKSFSPFAQITKTDPVHAIANFLTGMPARNSSETDTVKVLALRVHFQPDETPATTGDGLFDLSETSEYDFDRPPHNRAYFQQQMTALSNYFRHVSGQKLVIQAEVMPDEQDSSYQLPNDMTYYSGLRDEKLKSQRWAELLRDSIQKSKERDQLDFTSYNVFFIFHAGVGADFSFDYDDSPYDIQSVFLDFETLKTTLGAGDPNFAGLENGAIKEAIILPECQSQNGYDLALLGSMTLLLGSQLGMPSLFDTESGRAGIGRWGLMDQGSYNGQGLLPAEPCAFSKMFMGWEKPVIVSNATGLKIGCSLSNDAPHLIKIPITSSEYFLLENRQRDWDGNERTFGWDESGMRVQFDSTGKISWMPADSHPGVITRISEYDYGLPGSGLLIWHIDEQVIREHLAANQINIDRDHRGVDLVECDGAQDIGYYYSIFDAAYGTESGDYFDPYWAGNASHKIVNKTKVVEFSSGTIPNSNSYSGGKTHIRIYDISSNDSVMTVSIAQDMSQPGFSPPKNTGNDFSDASLLTLHLQHGAAQAVAAVAHNGTILAWKGDGSKLIDNDAMIVTKDINGHESEHPLALFAETQDSVLQPSAAIDLDNDGNDEVIAIDKKGVVYIWNCLDNDSNGQADLVASLNLGQEVTAGPMLLTAAEWQDRKIAAGSATGQLFVMALQGNEIVIHAQKFLDSGAIVGLARMSAGHGDIVATTGGSYIYCLDMAGNILWQNFLRGTGLRFQPMVLDSENPAETTVFALSETGMMQSFDAEGKMKNISATSHSVKNAGIPGFANVDDDEFPEILCQTDDELWALKSSHVPALNYPIKIVNQFNVSPLFIKGETLLQDITLSATSDGLVHAITPAAKEYDGFPFCAGVEIAATPALADLDQDGDWEMIVLSSDGYLYVWDLSFAVTGGLADWTQWGGDAARTFYKKYKGSAIDAKAELLPSKKVFCYPNPSRDNHVYIRYTLNKSAHAVNIRIYDLAGEHVAEFFGDGTPGDHELMWDLKQIQSGVYIARLEAQTGSESRVEFIKIAVVK